MTQTLCAVKWRQIIGSLRYSLPFLCVSSFDTIVFSPYPAFPSNSAARSMSPHRWQVTRVILLFAPARQADVSEEAMIGKRCICP